jgi:hypothetical protein
MSNPESAEDQRRILHISEKEARAKLVEVFEVSGCTRPLLAVDLDDVLCQTTKCVAECASLFTIQAVQFVGPLIFGAVQGIIAGLGQTCRSNTFIVSPFTSALQRSPPYLQAPLADSTWYKVPLCSYEYFRLCRPE